MLDDMRMRQLTYNAGYPYSGIHVVTREQQ